MENIYVIRTIDFIKKHLYKINWRKLSSNPNAISILENTGNRRKKYERPMVVHIFSME